MFRSDLNRLTIAVDKDSARVIRDDLLTLASIDLENLTGKFDDSSINNRLDKIFEDGRIDSIEAPALFEGMKKTAGRDGMLNKDEATASLLHTTIQRFSPSPLKVRKNIGALFDEGMFEKILLAYFNIMQLGEFDGYIEDDPVRRERLVAATGLAKAHAEIMIETCENYLRHVTDRETSYFNFVSAENVLGILSWFNDGEPVTNLELKGTLQTLGYLRSVHSGLAQLERRFRDGIVSDGGDDVTTALNSPYAQALHLNCVFEGSFCDTKETPAYVARGIVGAVYSSGAEKLSFALADMFIEGFDGEYKDIVTGRLPSGFERWIEDDFTAFANAAVSLDSLAFFVAGSGVGMALARSAKVVQAVNTAGTFMKGAKYLIPGIQLISSRPGQSAAIGLLKFGGNVGVELAKATGYISGVHYLFGEVAARWTGRLYNFVLGAVQTFNPAVAWNVAKTLETGKGQELAAALFALRQRVVSEHAAELAQYSAMRWLRPSLKAIPAKVNHYVRLLKDVLGQIEKQDRAGAKALAAQTKIKQTAEKVRQMACTNPSAVEGRNIFGRLDSIYKSSIAAPDKLRALRALRNDVILLIKKSARPPEAPLPSSPVPPKPGPSRFERMMAYLSKPKEPAPAPTEPAAGTKVTPKNGDAAPQAAPMPAVATKAAGPFETFAEAPPETLDIAAISKATGGKVTVSNRTAKALEEFYQNNPSQRGSFWRKMNELATGSTQEWEKVKGATDGLYRRVDKYYRVLVIKKGSHFEIRNIIHRGHLHRGEFLKDFL